MNVYEYTSRTSLRGTDVIWENAAIPADVIETLATCQGLTAEQFLAENALKQISVRGTNTCTMDVDSGGIREVFLSFYGEPKLRDGSPFTAEVSAPIGFLTLEIGFAP